MFPEYSFFEGARFPFSFHHDLAEACYSRNFTENERLEPKVMKVWFGWFGLDEFPFSTWWFLGSIMIFRGVHPSSSHDFGVPKSASMISSATLSTLAPLFSAFSSRNFCWLWLGRNHGGLNPNRARWKGWDFEVEISNYHIFENIYTTLEYLEQYSFSKDIELLKESNIESSIPG